MTWYLWTRSYNVIIRMNWCDNIRAWMRWYHVDNVMICIWHCFGLDGVTCAEIIHFARQHHLVNYYITERSVRWYYGFSIAAASARVRPRPPASARVRPRPPVDPDDVNPLTRKIFNLSLSNLNEGRYPLRYFAIEILCPPMTRTTAFTAKWHSYPPNLQTAIYP